MKFRHLILNVLLSTDNWNTAALNAATYFLLPPPPIKAFVCTFKISLLHSPITEDQQTNPNKYKNLSGMYLLLQLG